MGNFLAEGGASGIGKSDLPPGRRAYRIAWRSSLGAGAPWFRNHPPGRWNASIPLPGSGRVASRQDAVLTRIAWRSSLGAGAPWFRNHPPGRGNAGIPLPGSCSPPGRRAYSDRSAILVWGGRPMVPESLSRPLECRHSASGIVILEPHGLSESKLFQESYVVFVEEAHVVDLVF